MTKFEADYIEAQNLDHALSKNNVWLNDVDLLIAMFGVVWTHFMNEKSTKMFTAVENGSKYNYAPQD